MSFLNQPLVYAVLVRSIKKRTRRVNVEANGDVTSNLSVGIYNVCVCERGWGWGWGKQTGVYFFKADVLCSNRDKDFDFYWLEET